MYPVFLIYPAISDDIERAMRRYSSKSLKILSLEWAAAGAENNAFVITI